MNCDKCNKNCTKYIWFGPKGSFCDNCVPRFECFNCNYFKNKKEAIDYGHKKLKKDGDYYFAIDDKERLIPCVDYFCADLEDLDTND